MNVLEILLNRRWILKSRDRELYYQVKEKLASGEEKKFLREMCIRDTAYIEIRGQLYNRTPMPQTFLWWANPAVPVNDLSLIHISFFPLGCLQEFLL